MLSNPDIIKVGTYTESRYFESHFEGKVKGLLNIQKMIEENYKDFDENAKRILCGGSQYGQTFSDWESIDLEEHQVRLATRKLRQLYVFRYVVKYLYNMHHLNQRLINMMYQKDYIDREDNFVELTEFRSRNYIDLDSIYGKTLPGLNVLIPKTAEECDDMLRLLKK